MKLRQFKHTRAALLLWTTAVFFIGYAVKAIEA